MEWKWKANCDRTKLMGVYLVTGSGRTTVVGVSISGARGVVGPLKWECTNLAAGSGRSFNTWWLGVVGPMLLLECIWCQEVVGSL